MLRRILDACDAKPSIAEVIRTHALARREGQPEDVANATVYLSSDASPFITGEVIEVTGSMAMY